MTPPPEESTLDDLGIPTFNKDGDNYYFTKAELLKLIQEREAIAYSKGAERAASYVGAGKKELKINTVCTICKTKTNETELA